ncbi:MAG: hypothetical protein ABW174_07955 [Flavitalea sp.]
MAYLSLEPFIPSGKDFEKSKQLFIELDFELSWQQDGLAGFKSGDCKFILQQYDDKHFAENLMISVHVENIDQFWKKMNKKDLPSKFGIPALREPVQQPYGKEVNVIDIAGVCWHFIES